MEDKRISKYGSSLRVLFYQFFPGGGIGRYTHELASAINRDSRVDVEVACSRDYEYLSGAPYRTWSSLQSFSHPIPIARKFRFLTAQVTNPIRCLNHAKTSRVDLIHFSNINHLTYRFWRARIRRQKYPYVATAHDVRRAGKILSRRWEDASLKQFYKDSGALFVHSEQQREDLKAFADIPDSMIHQVPHGIYSYPEPTDSPKRTRERLGIPGGRKIGLYFGMVREDKNLEGLLTGLSRISRSRPYLVIAGRMEKEGRQSEKFFRKRIKDLRLEEDVLIINRFVAPEEVGDFYQIADFSCLTYRNYFTSQSGVLNVAMHFRCPVIVTPAPTLAETLDRFDIGVRCGDDSPEAIAEGIQLMQSRLENGGEFEFGAYRLAHSWNTNAKKTIQVYSRIVGIA